MAFNRFAGSAAKERSVVAAGLLGSNFYGRKCSNHLFVLLFYSTHANLFRLSKRIAVRIDSSPSLRRDCFTGTCAEWRVIGPLERSRLRGCFEP